jgi:hypothetical protein
MKRLFALLLFAWPCFAQTFSGPITTQPLTYTASQSAGGTNLVFVSYCYNGCSGTPAPASDIASVADAAGDTYTADYAFTGPAGGATYVFRASNVSASSANVISVAIPSSTSSVMMVSLFPQNWIPDTAGNAGDLLYAFVAGPAGPFTAGAGYTLGNTGAFWADEYQILAAPGTLTATFGSLATKSVLAYKLAVAQAPLTLNIATKLVSCVKCDRTDDTPLSGSLVFLQNNASQTFALALDGTINLNVSISMVTDPVVFTVFYQTTNGNQATGGGWSWSVPRASLTAGVATLGQLSFGGIAFTLNSDGSVSFAGFLPAS